MAMTDYEGVTTSYDKGRGPKPYGLHTVYTDEHGERQRKAGFFVTAEERDAEITNAAMQLAAKKAEVAIEKAKRKAVMPALPAAPRGSELFETLALAWLDTVEEQRKASTFRGYRGLLTNHLLPIMRKYPVTDEVMTVALMIDVLGKQLHSRGAGLKVRLKAQNVLATFFGWVLTSGRVPGKILSQNPAQGLGLNLRQKGEPVPVEPEPNPMTHAQRDAFLAWQKDRGEALGDLTLYRLYVWLAYQGTRVGEACALLWSRIDFDNEQAHIIETYSGAQRWKEIKAEKEATGARNRGKAGKGLQPTKTQQLRQWVKLHPFVIDILREQEQANREAWLRRGRHGDQPTAVFLNSGNLDPLRSDNDRIGDVFREGCEALGLLGQDTTPPQPFTLHDLRATFITCAIRDGHPIEMVARHVGHRGTRTIEKHYLRYILEKGDNPWRKGLPR